MAMPGNDTSCCIGFRPHGALWFSHFARFSAAPVPPYFAGWWLFMSGVFTLFLWSAASPPRAIPLVFLVLSITFFLLPGAASTGLARPHRAGGYAELLTAVLCLVSGRGRGHLRHARAGRAAKRRPRVPARPRRASRLRPPRLPCLRQRLNRGKAMRSLIVTRLPRTTGGNFHA
jgi:hypothetical protein